LRATGVAGHSTSSRFKQSVLEGAGVVRSLRVGRESLFEFRPEPLFEARSYLERISDQWDQALARLKSFVET
jgi:hypothetical protein